MFRSPGMWDKFDLDCILGRMPVEESSHEFLVERSAINVDFLENGKTTEITAGAYLISFCEIVNSIQQI